MFVHFAFGALGKQEVIEEQTKKVIELILNGKRILVSRPSFFNIATIAAQSVILLSN